MNIRIHDNGNPDTVTHRFYDTAGNPVTEWLPGQPSDAKTYTILTPDRDAHWISRADSGVLWIDPDGDLVLSVYETDDDDVARATWTVHHPDEAGQGIVPVAVVRGTWVHLPA